jgi:hypothetical protein
MGQSVENNDKEEKYKHRYTFFQSVEVTDIQLIQT